MSKRLDLHNIFTDILGTTGQEITRVYFQPPSTVKMQYPCIVYGFNKITTDYANGKRYRSKKSYTVTIIDSNPDSLIPEKVQQLPYTGFDRHFTSNNLNHYVFTTYY